MGEQQAAEWWIKTGVVYGLGFVVLAVGSAIIMVFCWKMMWLVVGFVGDLRQWVPHWFQVSIESQKSVARSADTLSESIVVIHDKVNAVNDRTDSIHEGLGHVVAAVSTHFRKREGIGSDVIVHLDSAENSLKKRAS